MSKIQKLLDNCKKNLGIESDYKLAQAIEINRARISGYMNGKEFPDSYACTRIALILNKNPAEIIAMVEIEAEKNKTKKKFWRKFLICSKKTLQEI